MQKIVFVSTSIGFNVGNLHYGRNLLGLIIMMETAVNGLLFDFDGVISSLMARIGWPYLWALKKVKPDIKREIVIETAYQTLKQILTGEKVNPLYALNKFLEISNVRTLNSFQRLKFIITGVVMYYKSKMNIVPLPLVNETLEQLATHYKMGLVTSAERNVIEQAFTKIPSLRNFDVIITRDDCINAKPHPEGILKGVKGLGLKSSECLYVGDLPTDIIAARRANVRIVSIIGEFGPISGSRLSAYNPTYIIPLLKDLPQLLEKINGNGKK